MIIAESAGHPLYNGYGFMQPVNSFPLHKFTAYTDGEALRCTSYYGNGTVHSTWSANSSTPGTGYVPKGGYVRAVTRSTASSYKAYFSAGQPAQAGISAVGWSGTYNSAKVYPIATSMTGSFSANTRGSGEENLLTAYFTGTFTGMGWRTRYVHEVPGTTYYDARQISGEGFAALENSSMTSMFPPYATMTFTQRNSSTSMHFPNESATYQLINITGWSNLWISAAPVRMSATSTKARLEYPYEYIFYDLRYNYDQYFYSGRDMFHASAGDTGIRTAALSATDCSASMTPRSSTQHTGYVKDTIRAQAGIYLAEGGGTRTASALAYTLKYTASGTYFKSAYHPTYSALF